MSLLASAIQQQKKFYRGHSIIQLKLALPQRYALYSALRFWYNTLGFIMPSLLAPKAHALSQPLSITASSCTALKNLDPAKSAVTDDFCNISVFMYRVHRD